VTRLACGTGVAAGAVVSILMIGPAHGHVRTAAGPQRPNIVVITTDDQTFESMKVMERTNRLLGGQGVTFDNSFVSFSLCCPSRATFLTGQYAHNHGVQGNGPPEGGYYKLDSTNALAVWLQRAGYTTTLIGKYLNRYGTKDPYEIPPGWNDWHATIDPTTFQYYHYTLNENGHLVFRCPTDAPECYSTDVFARKAREAIRARATEAQPFFLWLAVLAPHAGGPTEPDDPPYPPTPAPAQRHHNYFAGTELPLDLSFNEVDVSDKPRPIRRLPRFNAQGARWLRENYQQELETLLAVDEAVQGIVETLRDTGVLERTLIVFTSDNGFFHGEHRIPNEKILPYEPSIRVPLIISGPGIPHGVHRSQLVANIDLAPTIVEAAHLTPGRTMDGHSLYPILRDPGKEYGRDIVIENSPGAAHFSGLRTRHFLYVEYDDGERELYDLVNDPYQLRSLHDDPAYADLQAELATRLAALRDCIGDGCTLPPDASFTVRSPRASGGCRRGPLTLHVTGAPSLTQVTFMVGGLPIATAQRRPFQVLVPRSRLVHGANRLRARISATGDQLVTRDLKARMC
jgi:N-acetylglucosamine-6-sulfatase